MKTPRGHRGSGALEAVVSLVLRYDLLRRRELREAFLSALSDQGGDRVPARLRPAEWEVIRSLSEAYLRGRITTVSDIHLLVGLSPSTARRRLRTLEALNIVLGRPDESDRRRRFIDLTEPYREVLDAYLEECSLEFKELIKLHDKRGREKAQERFGQTEERLAQAVEASGAGNWEWDLKSDRIFLSPRLKRMIGFDDDFPNTLSAWQSRMHPDDLALMGERIEDYVHGRSDMHDVDYRILHKDGHYIWLHSRGRVYRDEHGHRVRIVGMNFDVTKYKRVEEKLRESEERFRVALMNSPIVVHTQDRALRYTWVFNRDPKFSPEPVIGKRDEDILPPGEVRTLTEFKKNVLESGVGGRREFSFNLPVGVVTYDLTCEPLFDKQGNVVGITGASTDITERKRAEDALRECEAKFRDLAETSTP